jgi:hypothetical protein
MGEVVKIDEMRNDAGVLTGFSVGGYLLSRSGCQKAIRRIPAVEIVRTHRPFRMFGARDDFCEFVVGGKPFLAIDLYGENMEFWIVQKDIERDCPQLEKVRDAFQRGRKFFGLLPESF